MRQSFLSLMALMLLALAPRGAAQPGTPVTSTTVVFVPYDKVGGPKLGPGQAVLLPYAELLKLRDVTAGRLEPRAFQPVAALAQAVYQGTVEGDVARLDAEWTVETLARPDDRLELKLPLHGAAVESAVIEGARASLAPLEGTPQSGETGLRLLLGGEGRRTLKVRLAVPLTADGATRRLDFAVPRAAAASLSLKVPADVSLERTPESLPATAEPAPGGATLIKASAGSSDRLLLAFRPRVQATGAAAQARLAVEQQIALAVSARGAEAQVKMKASLLAGQTAALALELPPGVKLLGVSGPFVKDWTAAEGAGRRVTVTLVREVSQPFELTLAAQLETAATTATAQRLAIPEFRVSGAVQESGDILITPEAGLTIWPERTDGLEAVSTAAGEAAAARKFHFAQPGWQLVLTRRPMPARIRASGLALYEVTEEQTRLKSSQHLSIGGRGIFSVALQAPAGYELREAGPAETVSGFRQQGRRVEINFRGEQFKECALELAFQGPAIKAGARLSVEPVIVEGADENAGSLVLAMPLALRATEQATGGVEATDTRQLLPAVRPLLSGDIEPALGYRYFTAAARVQALIERQRTRLSCETALLATISPSLLRMDATLNYTVEFSAADVFQVLLPASAGEDVRITGADIKEKAPAVAGAKGGPDGLTTWTIRLQRRVLGPYRLGVSFDVPLAFETSQTLAVDVPRVKAAGVARETGTIGISRDENLEVLPVRSDGLETRDVKELPPAMANAFLGFRYFDPDHQALRLSLTRHAQEKVLTAVIRRVNLETVLSEQRLAVHEAIYEVQNNSEQYLELELPGNMMIWEAFVRGMPVRSTTRQKDGAHLIELTRSESMGSAFRVRVILHQVVGRTSGTMGLTGNLNFQPPRPLNMPVLRTTWKLYLPVGYQYLSFGGTMHRESGGSVPWIEPAAEKLLADLPARLAGGIARPDLNPPQASMPVAYNGTETEAEKKARLQGAAIEIPIVREGLQFEFSQTSGMGGIEIGYWKRKPLLIVQGLWGLLLLAGVLWLGIWQRQLGRALAVTVGLFILASLTNGLTGRLCATGYAASAVGFLAGLIVYGQRHWRAAQKAETPGPNPPAGGGAPGAGDPVREAADQALAEAGETPAPAADQPAAAGQPLAENEAAAADETPAGDSAAGAARERKKRTPREPGSKDAPKPKGSDPQNPDE